MKTATTANWLGPWSRASGDFIGEIIKRFPGFKIEIVDGKVKLEYLFAAGLWKDDLSENRTLVKTYQKLREAVEQAGLEVELESV